MAVVGHKYQNTGYYDKTFERFENFFVVLAINVSKCTLQISCKHSQLRLKREQSTKRIVAAPLCITSTLSMLKLEVSLNTTFLITEEVDS